MQTSLVRESFLAQKLVLAVVLPAVAGAVNASGLLALGVYTSHVTGHVSRVGDGLSNQNWLLVWKEGSLVLAFMVGVMISTALVEVAKTRTRARHAVPLLLEACILALYGTWAAWQTHETYKLTMTLLIALAMGIQNALVTRAFGAVVRTTHLTGVVTDIGIETTRLLFMLGSLRGTTGEPGFVRHRFFEDPQWAQLRTHLLVLGSFLIGAIMGPYGLRQIGQSAMSLLVLVLCALAGYDLFYGIKREPPIR